MKYSFIKLPSAKRSTASLWAGLVSCLVCMSILSVLIRDIWAAPDGEREKISVTTLRARALKIVAVDAGKPKLTATDGEGQRVIEVSPNAKVQLNGAPAKVEEIVPGDSVKFEINEHDEVTGVDATRLQAGIVLNIGGGAIEITTDYTDKHRFQLADDARVLLNGRESRLDELRRGDQAQISPDRMGLACKIDVARHSLIAQFWENFRHNLFKPLLLFFYMGFSVPLLKIAFEFPHVIYQGLTIYLLVSIGWHGGEELAELSGGVLRQALVFMVLGFCTNFAIGILAYGILRQFIPKMRRVDAATVAAYYGSDSAGTFVTCLGVLAAASIKYAAYMPVMLAVMEIPGCLVGLYLVSRLRRTGMDALGNMSDESGYDPHATSPLVNEIDVAEGHHHKTKHEKAVEVETRMALENKEDENGDGASHQAAGILSAEMLHEVFLNPGLFLLFGGIIIGFASRLQGHKVTDADDSLFVSLFQGMLCLFLLEMGMTASKKLKDLKAAGWRFILFGLLAPNIFATAGICVAHVFSLITGSPLQLGTYALFAVLCAAASYIAVPAIQRLAIPEASPTLPLAASLGLTFSYNVTIGIPVYIMIVQVVIMGFSVGGR